MSVFEQHRSPDGPKREILEETLERMVQSPHAAADFRDAIIERAEQLPLPRDSWWRRLGDIDIRAVLRPPRMMAVIWVGGLVCCMVGLLYMYQQLAGLQSENRPQQARQSQSRTVVAKQLDTAKPSTSAPGAPLHPLTQAERDALSRATLDVKPLEAGEVVGEPDRLLLWDRFLQVVQWTRSMVWDLWAKLQQVWDTHTLETAPADESTRP